jgi:hypothetical protein
MEALINFHVSSALFSTRNPKIFVKRLPKFQRFLRDDWYHLQYSTYNLSEEKGFICFLSEEKGFWGFLSEEKGFICFFHSPVCKICSI